MGDVREFVIRVGRGDVAELRGRLAGTRWGSDVPGVGWERGVPVGYLRELVGYWGGGFDWGAVEGRLNRMPQFRTEIDGQDVHFVHQRSARDGAVPLLLVHGWPGSFVEFTEVLPQLADAFHLVVPDVPGVGFSGPLREAGWTTGRIADAFLTLMGRLGYAEFGVQGGRSGARIAAEMGRRAPDRVIGVHLNGLVTPPTDDPGALAGLTEIEKERLGRLAELHTDGFGFAALQSTRPATLGHALLDSPAGQLAWTVEKLRAWSDARSPLPEDAVDRDLLLADASILWFTRTAASAAALFYEDAHDPNEVAPRPRGPVPTAVLATGTTDVAVRRFADREHHVTRWTEIERGGAFLALEQPAAFAEDVRDFFAAVRAAPDRLRG
ncbi:epoxide hydrolase [Actinocorallia sp. A-T 12471]|uniref:epoxide hydrolase n=1 Tax=Actinocorallia sp. A-T 12471 TaxID=3089813 RepID=UPI0029CF77B7|nr:epoxide hydrolase [Actinocorallia sp. A-T 12471]MDX6739366.1 epoxide hydrolase [Actinocorallia sp. A-T 12471]